MTDNEVDGLLDGQTLRVIREISYRDNDNEIYRFKIGDLVEVMTVRRFSNVAEVEGDLKINDRIFSHCPLHYDGHWLFETAFHKAKLKADRYKGVGY